MIESSTTSTPQWKFTFKTTSGGSYDLTAIAETEAEALLKVRKDLSEMTAEIDAQVEK